MHERQGARAGGAASGGTPGRSGRGLSGDGAHPHLPLPAAKPAQIAIGSGKREQRAVGALNALRVRGGVP